MTGARPALSRRLRLMGLAITLGAASMLASAPASARGPDGIADVAEKVIDAVVNISTSQTVEAKGGGDRGAMPQLPPGSPFEEFFDDFFKNRRGGGPARAATRTATCSRARPIRSAPASSSMPSGVVVTNNHVIADADEINVIMNDGTKIKAELVGVDKKTDIAVLKFKPVEAADRGEVRRFRQAAPRRLGDRDRQSVRPRRHGHRRHRLGAQPRHQPGTVRQLHPDRRRRSIAAIPADRCSTSKARWSASTR